MSEFGADHASPLANIVANSNAEPNTVAQSYRQSRASRHACVATRVAYLSGCVNQCLQLCIWAYMSTRDAL
eukprot:5727052-Pleurochrysis_carterae.AAC.1